MVAEALKEARPDAKFVAVDIQTIRWSDPIRKERYTYLTPRSVQEAIINFDQGKSPEPFSFQLRDGQTTVFGLSESQKEKQRAYSSERATAEKKREKRALMRTVVGGGPGTIPERVGGKSPPRAALHHPPIAGNRLEFGLRRLNK